MAFILRWLAALGLLSATYNPSGYSFAHWARQSLGQQMPMIVLAGIVLFIGYVIYLRATLRSIGGFGMILVAALVAALGWVLVDQGLLTLDNPSLTLRAPSRIEATPTRPTTPPPASPAPPRPSRGARSAR